MSKVILHIDLNTFFVRCEELKNPSLIGKPVIIGHKGRGGIVSTCSYEARKYGAKSGQPTYKALECCPNAILLHGDFEYYEKKSEEFFNFIKKVSPIIEKASIDECYVDITKQIQKYADPMKFLQAIQNGLLKETGLKCSIGVAPTKFLSKMASDMKKPMGITIIHRKDVRKMLDPLPIEDFFGIGKKTAPRLRALGINTIGDLAKLINDDNDTIKSEFGKFYYAIKEWINGYGSDVVDTSDWDPKSIGHSTTFKEDTNNKDIIIDYLRKMSHAVSFDAKEREKVGTSVQLVLKDSNFKTINRSKKLPNETNEESLIFRLACELLEQNYDGTAMIRLAGVTLQNLQDPHEVAHQMSIFDDFEEIKEKYATKLLIAELNRKMNGEVFKTAADHLREMKNGNK